MSADRILQLKLIADVSSIDDQMKGVEKSVGRARKSFQKLKGWVVPAMAGIGLSIASGIGDAIADATARAAELRRDLDTIEGLTISLELDPGKVEKSLQNLTVEGISLGFKEDAVVAAFTDALTRTGKVNRSLSLVGAAMDYARLRGVDMEEAVENTFDAIIGGGDEAEEKLGVFGDTFGERMDSFNEKYSNFAEDFALTDEGQWKTINAKWDARMLDLGAEFDALILWFKGGILELIPTWEGNFEQLGDIVGGLAEKIGDIDWWALGTDIVKGLGDGIEHWKDWLVTKLGNLADRMVEAIRGALNAIIEAWNSIGLPAGSVGIEGTIFHHKWDAWTVPQIAPLAEGGIVRRPTLALVGEAGPEAVIPLGPSGGGMGNTYNIRVSAAAASPADVGRAVVEAIEAHEKRAGAGWRA